MRTQLGVSDLALPKVPSLVAATLPMARRRKAVIAKALRVLTARRQWWAERLAAFDRTIARYEELQQRTAEYIAKLQGTDLRSLPGPTRWSGYRAHAIDCQCPGCRAPCEGDPTPL